jgi:hypothetical protein
MTGINFRCKNLNRIIPSKNNEIQLPSLSYEERVKVVECFIKKQPDSGNMQRLKRYMLTCVDYYHDKKCSKYHVNPEYRIRWQHHIRWILGSSIKLQKIHLVELDQDSKFRVKNQKMHFADNVDSTKIPLGKYKKLPAPQAELVKTFTKKYNEMKSKKHKNALDAIRKDRLVMDINYKYVKEEVDIKEAVVIDKWYCTPANDRAFWDNHVVTKDNCITKKCVCGEIHPFRISKTMQSAYKNDPNYIAEGKFAERHKQNEEWIHVSKGLKHTTKTIVQENFYSNYFGVLENVIPYNSRDKDYLPINLSPEIEDIELSMERKKSKEKNKKKGKNRKFKIKYKLDKDYDHDLRYEKCFISEHGTKRRRNYDREKNFFLIPIRDAIKISLSKIKGSKINAADDKLLRSMLLPSDKKIIISRYLSNNAGLLANYKTLDEQDTASKNLIPYDVD